MGPKYILRINILDSQTVTTLAIVSFGKVVDILK